LLSSKYNDFSRISKQLEVGKARKVPVAVAGSKDVQVGEGSGRSRRRKGSSTLIGNVGGELDDTSIAATCDTTFSQGAGSRIHEEVFDDLRLNGEFIDDEIHQRLIHFVAIAVASAELTGGTSERTSQSIAAHGQQMVAGFNVSALANFGQTSVSLAAGTTRASASIVTALATMAAVRSTGGWDALVPG